MREEEAEDGGGPSGHRPRGDRPHFRGTKSWSLPAQMRPRSTPRYIVRSYSEAVLIGRKPAVAPLQRSFLTECTYSTQQRFKAIVRYEPRLIPSRFSSTIVVWSESSRRRFKDAILFLPRLRVKSYSETVYSLAKEPRLAFTATVTSHRQGRGVELSRRYTAGIQLQPAPE